jgi:hypothetical protein
MDILKYMRWTKGWTRLLDLVVLMGGRRLMICMRWRVNRYYAKAAIFFPLFSFRIIVENVKKWRVL